MNNKLILQGISYSPEQDIFNVDFVNDDKNDYIRLKLQRFNKKWSSRYDKTLQIYGAYKFHKGDHIDKQTRLLLMDQIKQLKNKRLKVDVIQKMIRKSIINFQKQFKSLSSFDLIVTPKSSSNILESIIKQMSYRTGKNTLITTQDIVKASIDQIRFDGKLIKGDPELQEQVKGAFVKDNKGNLEFKLKTLSPRIRSNITHFLKFTDQTDRQILNAIVNGKILIVDDIYTSGTTLMQINRILREFGATQLKYFIFLMS